MAKFLCVQFGICPRADACEQISLKPGDNHNCPRNDPKCREQLVEIGGGLPRIVKIGLIAVPVAAVIAFGVWSLVGPSKTVEQLLTDVWPWLK